MNDDAPKKYTTSDYTVLNEHFSQAIARDNEIVKARRAATFWQNAKSWSLLLFFIGIAAMFIGKAFQLSKGETIIERVVEAPNVSSESQNNSSMTIDGEEVTIKTDVIHFKEVELNYKQRDGEVTTRHSYVDPRDPRPYTQSCYYRSFGFVIELSSKQENGNIINLSRDLSLESANALEITESDMNYLRRYCQYI